MRVISGDNPGTVRYVASEVGIKRPSLSITGPELAQLDNAAFKAAADKYTIFARVLPEQKEKLIRHFKKQRLFTGMVGDGVNDALALKKADLGVAMYAGAAASRRVADIILLNNSFTSLPLGMKLGNRIMQAIEVIASLFFHKIIYGVVLLFSTMLLGMTYPYAPRHITFMNMFLVTMPTLMWTLFPPLPRHRVNPKRFWRDTLGSIAPIAVITGLAVTFTYWIMSLVYADRPMAVATMTVLTATFFGVYMVFLVPNMLGVTVNRRAKYARRLYLIAVALVASTSFSIGFLRDFFDFSAPTIWILWPAITVIALAAAVQWQIAKTAAKRYLEK
jgi:cation-transporting ATPase E